MQLQMINLPDQSRKLGSFESIAKTTWGLNSTYNTRYI